MAAAPFDLDAIGAGLAGAAIAVELPRVLDASRTAIAARYALLPYWVSRLPCYNEYN